MNRDLDPISGKAVQVAQEIGLFSWLSKSPRSIDELAASCGCSPRGMRPLLNLLASVDLLRIKGSGFVLAPGAMRYVTRKWRTQFEAFPVIAEYEELGRAVRYGRPVRAPVEGSEDEGAFFAQVVPVLFDLHRPDAEFLAEQLPPSVRRVLDLGAGSAVWSIPLASRLPEVHAVAVDRPRVLDEVTRHFLQRHHLLERYELWPGDYHQITLPENSFDVICLGHLLHADGWDLSATLLQRCYAATAPGGYLVVAEIVGSEPRSRHYESNVFDLSMLMLTEAGVVFTAAELETLVWQAGFQGPRWVEGPGEYPVLLARKAEAG